MSVDVLLKKKIAMVENIQNYLKLLSVLWLKPRAQIINQCLRSLLSSSSSPAFCWHSLTVSRYFDCITLVESPEIAVRQSQKCLFFLCLLLLTQLSDEFCSAVKSGKTKARCCFNMVRANSFLATSLAMRHISYPKVFTHTEVDLDSSSVTCTPKNKKIKSLKKLFTGRHLYNLRWIQQIISTDPKFLIISD